MDKIQAQTTHQILVALGKLNVWLETNEKKNMQVLLMKKILKKAEVMGTFSTASTAKK